LILYGLYRFLHLALRRSIAVQPYAEGRKYCNHVLDEIVIRLRRIDNNIFPPCAVIVPVFKLLRILPADRSHVLIATEFFQPFFVLLNPFPLGLLQYGNHQKSSEDI
jgi:hypothetical protein